MAASPVLVNRDPFICVVDDHESVREALLGLLRSIGLRVETFESAESLCESRSLGKADCLIVDIHLPGMSGLQLLAQLRARCFTMPAILITSPADERTRELVAEAGAHALLIKPFVEEELLAALDSALASLRVRDERAR